MADRLIRPTGGVLVAGIGNIFRSDDGFGVEVARRLADGRLGPAVRVVDFGIRGIHLAYEMTDGKYHTVVLVDTAARGGAPGTLYAIEPELDDFTGAAADAHSLTPAAVLTWARRVADCRSRIVVVGCEPECIDAGVGLSGPVTAAIEPAIEMVRELVAHAQAV